MKLMFSYRVFGRVKPTLKQDADVARVRISEPTPNLAMNQRFSLMNTQNHEVFSLRQGVAPILISIPHLGTSVPLELRPQYQEHALRVPDTDWHLDRLYDFADNLGIGVIQAKVSRYVIDLNRPPTGESLYPGQNTTGLCPTLTFRDEAVYQAGQEPSQNEVERRVAQYWRPYHDALQQELQRLKEQHGSLLLWEAHSIASVLPHLFSGKLPDLNFGTNSGAACPDELLEAVVQALPTDSGMTRVVNDRFKGGYITRHFARPEQGINAIQLEMCQSLYMDEAYPFNYREDKARHVKPALQAMLEAALKRLGH